jgi:hypothetical protein
VITAMHPMTVVAVVAMTTATQRAFVIVFADPAFDAFNRRQAAIADLCDFFQCFAFQQQASDFHVFLFVGWAAAEFLFPRAAIFAQGAAAHFCGV